MELQEEYVKPPPPDYLPPSGQKCAVGPLPEGYAIPTSRFTIRDFKVVVALCQATETGHGECCISVSPLQEGASCGCCVSRLRRFTGPISLEATEVRWTFLCV